MTTTPTSEGAPTMTTEVYTIIYELDGDIYLKGEGFTQSTGLHFDADGGEWEAPVTELIRAELNMVVVSEWTEHADQSVTAEVTEREGRDHAYPQHRL